MSNPVIASILSSLVGAIAALVTIAATQHMSPIGTVPMRANTSDIAEQSARQDAQLVVVQSDVSQLRALRQEIDSLRLKQSSRDSELPSTAPEERVKPADERFADLDRLHHQDPADPSWAPQASRSLGESLAKIGAQQGFVAQETTCKTTWCRATLEWQNYAEACATGLSLSEATFPGFNCVQRIHLKAPEDPNARYTANLYLDCAAQRAGQTEVAPTQSS